MFFAYSYAGPCAYYINIPVLRLRIHVGQSGLWERYAGVESRVSMTIGWIVQAITTAMQWSSWSATRERSDHLVRAPSRSEHFTSRKITSADRHRAQCTLMQSSASNSLRHFCTPPRKSRAKAEPARHRTFEGRSRIVDSEEKQDAVATCARRQIESRGIIRKKLVFESFAAAVCSTRAGHCRGSPRVAASFDGNRRELQAVTRSRDQPTS